MSDLNFTLTVPPNISLSTAGSASVPGDWTNCLKRWFIPGFASAQDKKVTEYFTEKFKEFIHSETPIDRERIKSDLDLAEQHIATSRQSTKAEIARLEHYTLVVRDRLKLFAPSQSRHALMDRCRSGNQAALARWLKCGFSEEIFWAHPDLVDFIFQAHLHRHINHPYYKHTITMQHRIARREGQITTVKEPHLLFNGQRMAWSEIRKKIFIDNQARLYTKENGQKKRWTYLENGFTELKDDHFAAPQRLRKLDRAPVLSQIQIVTTHAHPGDWNIVDRVLEGTRHSFIRIIPGAGFSQRHPEMRMEDGSVYSIGWGTNWRDFDICSPLSTLKGRWYCPDDWEFLPQDHCVTTKEVADAKVLKLMEIIRRRSREERPFHFITANCCGNTAEVLNEAGIIDLDTKNHMARLKYEFFIPKFIRIHLDKILFKVDRSTPQFITDAFQRLGAFLYSIVFAPIFSLLGAWRTKISFEEEDEGRNDMRVTASNRIKALFSNVFDLFRPSKMEFDMTKNIYKWQRKQPETIYEKRD
jgi:hypothetical protein